MATAAPRRAERAATEAMLDRLAPSVRRMHAAGGAANVSVDLRGEPGLDVIARADMVAVITSSAGYEAAVMGKQVLHFGRYENLIRLFFGRPSQT